MSSPIGKLLLVAINDKLSAIHFNAEKIVIPKNWQLKKELFNDATQQLMEYFAGKRQIFSLKTHLANASKFQQQVYAAMQQIPYGTLRSYSDIAIAINNPRAYRAVGNAAHCNPLPIVFPCHRIIRKNNDIGGFAYPLSLKKKLLKIESIDLA